MFPERAGSYRYTSGERLPIEILVFEVDPADVDEFLAVDHDVWTIGEAFVPGSDHIPFLSKEVWLDDTRPGEITLLFVFESREAWEHLDVEYLQQSLGEEFDRRFTRPYRLTRAVHEESDFGIHRWSRFERT
jgi:uncharacterized protein (TIGR03792 family)